MYPMRHMFCLWKPKGRSNFSVRVLVPNDLHAAVGQREIVRSLGTAERREAKRKLAFILPTIIAKIEDARRNQERWAVLDTPVTASAVRTRSRRVIDVGDGISGTRQARPQPRQTVTPVRRLVDAFLATKGSHDPRTQGDYALAGKALCETIAAKPIEDVKRADLRAVRDLIASLPHSVTKRYPGKALRHAAEHREADGFDLMSRRTIEKHVSAVASIWSWAAREDYPVTCSAAKLTADLPKVNRKTKRPFTPDELRAIFAAIPDTWRTDKPAWFWLPRIAVLSGMRMNEIAQLRTEDIRTVNGVLCFHVRAGDGQRLKTANAERLVPVHSALLADGVEDLATGGNLAGGFLFDLPTYRGDRAQPFSKAWGKWFRTINADRAVSFHSFRHVVAQALKDAEVPLTTIRALMGWASSGMEAHYGGQTSPATLRAAIERLKLSI
jgi:integrase